MLEFLLQNSAVQDELLSSLGNQSKLSDDVLGRVSELRERVRDLLVRNRREHMPAQCSVDRVCTADYHTEVRGELLSYWAGCVDDPAQPVAEWLIHGAPAGLRCDTSELDGVCPRVESTREGDFNELETEFGSFANYSGVEENAEAAEALESYVKKGYLMKFGSLEDMERYLGEKPVLSKIGCIVKQKKNHVTGTVTTKTRIILDCKASSVSRVADRTHKSVLPRVTDAIQSALSVQADLRAGESLVFLVADVVDAFWLIPLRKEERRFFCAKLRGGYYCFLRTAQGSRGAPLTFAAVIALAARFVQSIHSTPMHHSLWTEEARMQVYVDDPLFMIRGSGARVKQLAAVILLSWTVMGFPLAFHKAMLGQKMT